MVKRYDWKYDGMDGYDLGAYVGYDDYAALEARLAELEKDAARYRWLRDKPWSSDEFGSRLRVAIQIQMNAIWDKEIDEAMSREA